ncbi:GNAT family N-acetyltransferase [Bacillus alkalicellulosilyticus]|uniref:GNAT family N-acetyltransferase n=1 Tax=Alkalihalobacterium alkalicellulosilyticum TaxID=1912214 RepID=UPI000995FC27|nr:GNAT family N-acetyltransferase [Bacillus alkalicellulosilyticus]
MNIRNVTASDYNVISPLLNEWWGGRNVSNMLPKLFFDHFNNTSFAYEKDGHILGFLIGFLSQSETDTAYIHFVGVHPEHRHLHIGRQLYHEFFNMVKKNNRQIVRAVTSPVNKGSIAYHTKMGFDIEKGDKEVDGVSVFSNYDGPNQDRVLFVKSLKGELQQGI